MRWPSKVMYLRNERDRWRNTWGWFKGSNEAGLNRTLVVREYTDRRMFLCRRERVSKKSESKQGKLVHQGLARRCIYSGSTGSTPASRWRLSTRMKGELIYPELHPHTPRWKALILALLYRNSNSITAIMNHCYDFLIHYPEAFTWKGSEARPKRTNTSNHERTEI